MMKNKDLAKAEERFEKFLPLLKQKGFVSAGSMAEQFPLLSDSSKISFMSKFWSSRTTDKGCLAALSFMPLLSYMSIKDHIEENEPEGIWQNIQDILYGYAPHELQSFVYPVNLIKANYVQRAKFIDEYLDKKLQEPLSKQAYFARPENLEPYARARGENDVVVERLIELKRRNQEDMQIILKSRAGIQDDQVDDKATEKL